MITKKYNPKDSTCILQFEVPAEFAEQHIAVVGDFNAWNPNAKSLSFVKTRKVWKGEVKVAIGRSYQFRYFGDKGWFNDETADAYQTGAFTAENSVVTV